MRAANSSLAASERDAVMTVAPASASASEILLPKSGPAPAVTSAVLPSSENLSSTPMDRSFLRLSGCVAAEYIFNILASQDLLARKRARERSRHGSRKGPLG